MDDTAEDPETRFERFRPYLRFLARLQLEGALQSKLDASDLVQETLLEAYKKQKQFRGSTEGEWLAWLRQILAHNLADARRRFDQAKRDQSRERSLEAELAHSSLQLGRWLVAEQPSPSEEAQQHERALRLAKAMEELPERQREALLLRYWQSWPLARIAEHMGRSQAAAASLLKRGLRQLRVLLDESE